jgi:nucleoside-diphosphate-sugar epimerase
MRSVRYVVTGGAGFIGSHIVDALVARGQTVCVFDNLSTGHRANLAHHHGRVELIEGDLRDFSAVSAALKGAEVVFHGGGLASVPASIADPAAALEINVNGTHNVLLAARELGVRRIVYASSSAVYGDLPELPKHEALLPAPKSPYAAHKLAGEQLCMVFTQVFGLETVALRYFNVFGPRQDPRSEYAAVIPRFISALLRGERPIVYGDGEQSRDFVYVDDVVQANLYAAESSAAVGRVMNIGHGQQSSLNDILRTVGDLLGVIPRAEYQETRPGDVRDSVADISRAQDLLGYSPTIGLREGLARTIDALRLGDGASAAAAVVTANPYATSRVAGDQPSGEAPRGLD